MANHLPIYSAKLIVLRGNSGSGKTTAAYALREVSDHKIAIVEQDYVRRKVLREKDVDNAFNIELIPQMVEFALARNYDVVLEGILGFSRYGKMLEKLVSMCPDNHFYYFKVSLDETVRRHATKSNAHEFGRTEMERWYREKDTTNFEGEIIIPEGHTLEDAVKMIKETSKL